MKSRQVPMRFRTHGGARRGAGRKPRGPRASEKHRLRPRVEPTHPLHVVIRVVGGIRLRRRAGWRAIRHAMGVALARHDFRICHVSIQASHVHLIVEADDKTALARGMQGFQIACARRFNRYLRRKGTLFSDRYHPVPLRSPQQVRNAVSYCLNNWRRHREDRFAPGVVMDPYSSAHSFAPWHPRPRSETHPDEERLPVVVPGTWLLGVGWKRHRPISPRERPGPIEPPRRTT
jgi:putative transposase